MDTKQTDVQKKVPIPGESNDQRAVRTRERLCWALIDLLREKKYEDIEVHEIAARAGVGRSTFYTHFADKDDMFIQHGIAFYRKAGEHLTYDPNLGTWRFPVALLFEHAREFRFLYDAFVRSPKLDRMLKIRQITLAESFQRRMTEAGAPSDVPIPLLAQHYAATLINLLSWWMDHHCPCSAQDMERYFHRLVNGPTAPGSGA